MTKNIKIILNGKKENYLAGVKIGSKKEQNKRRGKEKKGELKHKQD